MITVHNVLDLLACKFSGLCVCICLTQYIDFGQIGVCPYHEKEIKRMEWF